MSENQTATFVYGERQHVATLTEEELETIEQLVPQVFQAAGWGEPPAVYHVTVVDDAGEALSGVELDWNVFSGDTVSILDGPAEEAETVVEGETGASAGAEGGG